MAIPNTMHTSLTIDAETTFERIIPVDVEFELTLGHPGSFDDAPVHASLDLISVTDDYDEDLLGGMTEKDQRALQMECLEDVLTEANAAYMEGRAVKAFANVRQSLENLRLDIERRLT